jgi:hypothetical protein
MADVLDRDAWETANGAFLTASVEWTRLLLRHYAQRSGDQQPRGLLPASMAEAGPVAPAAARRARFGRRPEPQPALPAPVEPGQRQGGPPEPEVVTSAEVAAAAEAVTAAERMTPPPALVSLASALGLSRFERDLLLLCAAIELDPTVAALCAAVHASDRMPFPTFALAFGVLPNPAWDALSPQRGLRYWRLVEINQPAGQPLMSSGLRIDERILNHLKGLDYLDDRLHPLATAVAVDESLPLPGSQQALVDLASRRWHVHDAVTPVLQLTGADTSSKQLVAAATASGFALATYRMPASLLPTLAEELENLARLWQREAVLLPMALYLDAEDADESSPDAPPIGRFLSRLRSPTFLAVRESWRQTGREAVVIDVAPPTTPERAAAWRAALDPGTDDRVVEALAGQFALDVAAITELGASTGPDELWQACLARTRPRLESLAQRLTPMAGWDDIVLPDEGMRALRQIAGQVAQRSTVYERWGFGERDSRGLGLSVLFAGPSGTGKTLAAEVLAHELRLDLYRTDLSAVVSKYVGETEKNLRRLFDAAEAGGAILLIDEADALLGKRTEVKDAHDRYANIESAYLLQRMEAYRGLAIMATNVRSALDTAFLRRLRFIVEFPFPDTAQRREIWRRVFPPRGPGRDELDFDRLAELQVSGGMARNIMCNAAFLAASAGSPITMPLVLDAARDEFRKLQLPVRRHDFAWTPAEAASA